MAQSGPNRPTVLQGKGKQTRTSQRTTTLLLLELFGQSIDPLGQLALLSLRGTLLLSLELTNASCKLIAQRSDLSGGLLLQDTLLGLLLGGHGCVGARAGGNVRWGAGRHILEARARVQGALLCDGLVFPIMVSNGP